MSSGAFPGERYAMQVIHPGSPTLRVRYRAGILVTPSGVPDWLLYARAVVELPPVRSDLTREETRVVDVLAANEAMVVAGDPLWEFTKGDYAARTPPGWTWAHLTEGRQLALVPVELHGSYRHIGGVNLLKGTRPGARGLRLDEPPRPVPQEVTEVLAEDLPDKLDEHLGHPLPPRFRAYLAGSNGGAPGEPGVLPAYGFVADQRLFGLARTDRQQDLVYANGWLGDRFTADFLAIGYVQGGMLAVKVRGEDPDSVWYWDDDDPRDGDAFDAAYICANLLHRVADDIDAFWAALAVPSAALAAIVDQWVAAGQAREIRPEMAGVSLPANRRPPWQPAATTADDNGFLAEFTADR